MNGTCIKQDFYILQVNTTKDETLFTKDLFSKCCYHLPALASNTITDRHANDFHSPLWFFGVTTDSVTMALEKETNGVYNSVATLDNNTYGTYYALGFFTNRFAERGVGYRIEWKNVLNEHGEGCYRIACNYTDAILGNGAYYSFEFDLKTYTAERADNTTRLEWVKNGKIGAADNDSRVLDYGFNEWVNCLRIPDSFVIGGEGSYTRDEIKYQTGEIVWTQESQVEKYTFEIGLAPEYMHKYVKTEIFMSDQILITDYNTQNPTKHISRAVRLDGDYSPNYQFGAEMAEVSCTLKQAIQNLTMKRE